MFFTLSHPAQRGTVTALCSGTTLPPLMVSVPAAGVLVAPPFELIVIVEFEAGGAISARAFPFPLFAAAGGVPAAGAGCPLPDVLIEMVEPAEPAGLEPASALPACPGAVLVVCEFGAPGAPAAPDVVLVDSVVAGAAGGRGAIWPTAGMPAGPIIGNEPSGHWHSQLQASSSMAPEGGTPVAAEPAFAFPPFVPVAPLPTSTVIVLPVPAAAGAAPTAVLPPLAAPSGAGIVIVELKVVEFPAAAAVGVLAAAPAPPATLTEIVELPGAAAGLPARPWPC